MTPWEIWTCKVCIWAVYKRDIHLFIYLFIINLVNFRKSFATLYLTNLFSSLCKFENSWYDRKLRAPHRPLNFTKIAVLLCKNMAKRIISRKTEEGSPPPPPPPPPPPLQSPPPPKEKKNNKKKVLSSNLQPYFCHYSNKRSTAT